MASLVRVGGAVTVVWPPTVVTSPATGVTVQVSWLNQIIRGEVEVQPGGTVMVEAFPGSPPAVFVNPYSRPSSELVLSVGRVEQSLVIGNGLGVYATHRAGGLTDYRVNMTVDRGPSDEPVKSKDGWLIATVPGPAYDDAMIKEFEELSRRVATSRVVRFDDGSWGVVLQYNADNPHWEVDEWEDMTILDYNERGSAAAWEDGFVLTSELSLPMRADKADYASKGITLHGTFHRAAELGGMGVWLGD